MTDGQQPATGAIAWWDLTVPDAATVRDFYSAVVGWRAEPVDMGDYSDFAMKLPDSDTAAAGICYARGENANQPALWMPYITVEDVEASVARCLELGGQKVTDIRDAGGAKFAVIRDPAGAAFGLIEMPTG